MSRTSRLPWVVLLVLVALASALAIVVAFRHGDGTASGSSGGNTESAPRDPVVATGTLSPPVVLFGDTLTARVDVVVDRAVVDPSSVKVAWNSSPWGVVGIPSTTVESAGGTTLIRTTWVLRCLTSICAPVRETDRVDLAPVRVSYNAPVGGERRLVQRVRWPTLIVHTRVGDLDPASSDALAAPWRADLVSVPAASYRVPPRLVVGVLVAVGLALLALAAFLVYRAWPRREPEPEPEPVASPLEQALQLLEHAEDRGGVEERRRALELVADEVENVGEPDLALDARALAWSSTAPEAERAQRLAALLRIRLAPLLEAEQEAADAAGRDAAERTNGVPV